MAERMINKPLKENSYFKFIIVGFLEDQRYELIGKDVPSKESEKVTGQAVYIRDIVLPGMLYAKWMASPYAHAKIKRVFISKAKELPGVVDIIVYGDQDLKSDHPEGKGAGTSVKCADWAFVLPSEAVYEGQPVGVAVCGESPRICDEALRLIRIEWEELPFVLSREEALKVGAPIAQLFREQSDNIVRELPGTAGTTRFIKGDVEEGFEKADGIIEFTLNCGVNVHAGVEPMSCIAWYHEGVLELWIRNQLPQGMLLAVRPAAEAVGVSLNKVKVHQPYSGASFGGINFVGNGAIPCILAAILSKRTRRPVKVLAEWSNFSGIIGEEEGKYHVRVGFKKDGKVTAVKIISNGTYGYAGLTIPGSKKLPKATSIPNIYCESIYPYTNRAPCVCFKHGTQETIPFVEIFNRVAAELNMDPTEVAVKNDGCDGMPMHPDLDEIKKEQGFPVRDSLKECIEVGKRIIEWDRKWHPPGACKLPNGNYHGLGFAWNKVWRTAPEVPAKFRVSVFLKPDGTAIIKGQRSIVGVAEPTTYCQIFAEESGVRYEDVFFDHEFQEAPMMTPGGSGGLIWNSYLVRELGIKTKQKLLEVAARHLGKPLTDLEIKNSRIWVRNNPSYGVSVSELVTKYPDDFHFGIWADGYSFIRAIEIPPSPRKAYFWGRQVCFIEVEVDPETGKIYITNLVIVNDVGKVINPSSVSGQQYGGAFMGIGRAMTEEIIYDPLTGVKLNDDLTQYYVLTMGDVFPVHCVAIETLLGYGAYGNFGIGENPNALVRTVLRSAVYNAIGKWINEDPITPERVLKALGKI